LLLKKHYDIACLIERIRIASDITGYPGLLGVHDLISVISCRAALTSARTTANSIYIPPRVQVGITVITFTLFIIV
jgi:hypothetical protein